MLSPSTRTRPLVALQALRDLSNDPDDLAKVFTVIEALPGRSPARMLRRMRSTTEGRDLLEKRPDLRARLADRPRLRASAPGTLGRAYADFMDREGITTDGIVEASVDGTEHPDAATEVQRFIGDRMRDTHDLWHVVTGYGTDLLGEAALLAFTYAQTKHPGVALIALLAIIRSVPGAPQLMKNGYLRGRRATWLPSVAWEELLDLPLDKVRARLGSGETPSYAPVTTVALRAARAA